MNDDETIRRLRGELAAARCQIGLLIDERNDCRDDARYDRAMIVTLWATVIAMTLGFLAL